MNDILRNIRIFVCVPKPIHMASILNIINTLQSKVIYLRTIEHIAVDRSTICAGNNAVTARCRVMPREGWWLIKCYYRPKHNLKTIYEDNFYEHELGVYSIDGAMEFIDIVLLPWVDGEPLDRFIARENTDYKVLSRAFDTLALNLLESEYAHGDIKPDNIIVGKDHQMTLIDLDAMWRPEFGNNLSAEIGTIGYRHPKRLDNYYKKAVDDYPLALIATELAALALDSNLEQQLSNDKSLLSPESCVYDADPMLEYIIELFKNHGDITHKHIAETLKSPSPIIHGLHKMFYISVNGNSKGYNEPKHECLGHRLRKPKPIRSNGWSPDDDLKLAMLLFDGNRISSIARHMQRSERVIRNRAQKLNIPLSELNRRKPIKQYMCSCQKPKDKKL